MSETHRSKALKQYVFRFATTLDLLLFPATNGTQMGSASSSPPPPKKNTKKENAENATAKPIQKQPAPDGPGFLYANQGIDTVGPSLPGTPFGSNNIADNKNNWALLRALQPAPARLQHAVT